MLWGLLRFTLGSATLRSTRHVRAFTDVAVPGLVLPAVSSYCVLTQTSPTPVTAGLNSGGSGVSLP